MKYAIFPFPCHLCLAKAMNNSMTLEGLGWHRAQGLGWYTSYSSFIPQRKRHFQVEVAEITSVRKGAV